MSSSMRTFIEHKGLWEEFCNFYTSTKLGKAEEKRRANGVKEQLREQSPYFYTPKVSRTEREIRKALARELYKNTKLTYREIGLKFNPPVCAETIRQYINF